jgi:hypothetical protein
MVYYKNKNYCKETVKEAILIKDGINKLKRSKCKETIRSF